MFELRANVMAYDAVYVAVAEGLGCEPWTADPRLASAPFAATVTSSSWLADLRKGGRGRIRHVYMANGLPQTLMGPPILFP